MSTFLEKDHLVNLLGIDLIRMGTEKYGTIDYELFKKEYEPKNAAAMYIAHLLVFGILPDLERATSVILTGKEHTLSRLMPGNLTTKFLLESKNRINRLIKKRTPKFLLKRLERAVEISPFVSLIGLPYQISSNSLVDLAAFLGKYLFEGLAKRDIVFAMIKSAEHSLKFAEELVKFGLMVKDEYIDREFPTRLIGVIPKEELFISALATTNNLFIKGIEQALKNSGFTGIDPINIKAHYDNCMGRPQPMPELIEPITFPLFGTTIRINTSASSVNYKTLPLKPAMAGFARLPKDPVTPPVAPPVDPVVPVDPVTPVDPVVPVDPVTPVDPVVPPTSNSYAKVAEFKQLVSKIYEAVEAKTAFINSIEAINTVRYYQQSYVKQIIFSYACVLYAHKVSMLGSIDPEQYVAATSAIKQEVFGSLLVSMTEVIPMIEAWEAQGNRIENFGDASVDNRYLSFEQAQYALYTLGVLRAKIDLADGLNFNMRSIPKNVPTEEQFYAMPIAEQDSFLKDLEIYMAALSASFGYTGDYIILPEDVHGGRVGAFIRARREEFFSQPGIIAAEEEAGVYRFAYLVTDGLLPQSNFVPVMEPTQPGPVSPNNSDRLVELSGFAQQLIDDQSNAGLVGRIIASAYSILMQRIFTNNVNAGVLEFEGVSVEVTNPEAMATQITALKEKVLSLLVSIPESSPMHGNFSLIKQKLMDDSNNYQELSALVLDTAQSVYKVGDEIGAAAQTVFLNVLGLNVIGNQMAGVDPTSNALEISRILLDRPITSMDGLDPAEVVSSFAPVLDFKNSTNV